MKMPFDRWLQRIMHRPVAPSIVSAVEVMLGEDAARALAADKRSDKIRAVVRRVEYAKKRCARAVGGMLRVDTGDTVRGPYGHGRILHRGLVRCAVPVIVEEPVMRLRTLAYDVELEMGHGKVVHYVVDSIETIKEQEAL
jgi:hypothetical protein